MEGHPRIVADGAVGMMQPTASAMAQALGKDDKDLQQYKSREVTVRLHKDKLLKINKNGHSWSQVIPIEVNNTKAVILRIFLLPALSRGEAERAVLHVTAEVKPSLVKECGQNCWVVVETKVTDQETGTIYVADFNPQQIKDGDGKMAFCQDLACCEDVKKCEGRTVNVVLSATFVTCTCPFNAYHMRNEDEFCVISLQG